MLLLKVLESPEGATSFPYDQLTTLGLVVAKWKPTDEIPLGLERKPGYSRLAVLADVDCFTCADMAQDWWIWLINSIQSFLQIIGWNGSSRTNKDDFAFRLSSDEIRLVMDFQPASNSNFKSDLKQKRGEDTNNECAWEI